jgi:branched-chain amino acid transport system ATP-binding protein
VLEVEGVTAGYGPHVVLREVSLTVPDHAVVALLGPNGAGKTTLLRVVSGLLRPSQGTVRLDGKDVTGWPPHRLARLGVCHVPEGRGIHVSLSVGQNIRLQAPPAGDRRAATVVASQFPRLGERLSQMAGTMSGGEQQMLALSRAYLARPEVLLLDEVSMGLAPKIVDEIFDHLRGVVQGGAALLLVEQYVTKALEMANYVYILNRGRIQFAGEPGELSNTRILSSYLGAVV